MKRTVDKTKKSNIKCEHCKNWNRITSYCCIQNQYIDYWRRCKEFGWCTDREYKKIESDET